MHSRRGSHNVQIVVIAERGDQQASQSGLGFHQFPMHFRFQPSAESVSVQPADECVSCATG